MPSLWVDLDNTQHIGFLAHSEDLVHALGTIETLCNPVRSLNPPQANIDENAKDSKGLQRQRLVFDIFRHLGENSRT